MEWKEVRLGDVCTRVCSGGTPKSTNLSYYGGEIPWLNTKEIDFNRIYSTEKTITDSGLNNSSAKWIVPNTVTVAMYGATAGKSCIVKVPMTTNQACCNLTINDEVADYEFVYYTLKNDYTTLASLANGGAQQNLNAQIIKDYVLQMPSLADQRRIASILSSLDRKIELNNKINADLEEMAQAVFKNWFVDFEPFKDGKFVDSELGMIPEGWKVSQIADIPHILETGKRPKGGAVEKGIPSVGAEHVKGMCAYDYSKTKYINCEFAAKLKTGKINGYELMIYKDGGKPGYFIPNFSIFGEGYPFENCYLNEHVFKLDFDGNKEFNIFCYFFFKTEQIMSYFNAQGAKAAIPGINKKDVENIYIFSPDNESVIKFGEFAYPLFKQMLKNAIENRTLSTLRDTLLPRLMSGELEVPE